MWLFIHQAALAVGQAVLSAALATLNSRACTSVGGDAAGVFANVTAYCASNHTDPAACFAVAESTCGFDFNGPDLITNMTQVRKPD